MKTRPEQAIEAGEVGNVETVLDVKKPAFQFKRTKVVTVPLLKPALGVPFYVRADGEIYLGKELKATAGAKKMEPAHLMNCTNLETGELCQIIVPSVLLSIMTEEYPEKSYVGKSFEMTKLPKNSGKDYHGFTVNEIEVEAA